MLHSDDVISLPTFIIAECVLIYLDPDSSRAIAGWAARTFSTAVFVLYEQVLLNYPLALFVLLRLVPCINLFLVFDHQIHPDDAFGEQMIRNLEVTFVTILFCKCWYSCLLYTSPSPRD